MLFTDSSSILRGCHIVREPPNAAAVAPVARRGSDAGRVADIAIGFATIFFGTIFELRTLTRKMFVLCRN